MYSTKWKFSENSYFVWCEFWTYPRENLLWKICWEEIVADTRLLLSKWSHKYIESQLFLIFKKAAFSFSTNKPPLQGRWHQCILMLISQDNDHLITVTDSLHYKLDSASSASQQIQFSPKNFVVFCSLFSNVEMRRLPRIWWPASRIENQNFNGVEN